MNPARIGIDYAETLRKKFLQLEQKKEEKRLATQKKIRAAIHKDFLTTIYRSWLT